MDYYKKASRVIERLLSQGKQRFILYPFGGSGRMIKRMLNEVYAVKEVAVIDEKLSKYNSDIWSLDKLNEKEYDDCLILITSVEEAIYSEIRASVMEYVGIDRIIDVFSTSMYFDPQVYYDEPSYSYPRYRALETCAREIYRNAVSGDIVECGVYKGIFANHMTRQLPDRKIYLFDTFSGFDGRDIDEEEQEYSSKFRSKMSLSDTSVELALSNIAYRSNAIVRKGYFPDTAEGLENERFAFVSLDTDLYKPIYAGLEFFYPRLEPGGYIFVDDYGHHELLGVRKAVLDFCKKENIGFVPIYDGADSTAVISKPL